MESVHRALRRRNMSSVIGYRPFMAGIVIDVVESALLMMLRTAAVVLGVLRRIFIPSESIIMTECSVTTAAGTSTLSNDGIYLASAQRPISPVPKISTGAPSAIVMLCTTAEGAVLKWLRHGEHSALAPVSMMILTAELSLDVEGETAGLEWYRRTWVAAFLFSRSSLSFFQQQFALLSTQDGPWTLHCAVQARAW